MKKIKGKLFAAAFMAVALIANQSFVVGAKEVKAALCVPAVYYGTVTLDGVAVDNALVTLIDVTNGSTSLTTTTSGGGLYSLDAGNLGACAANGDQINIDASIGGFTASTVLTYNGQALTLVNLNIVSVVTDTTPPVITLLGTDPVDVSQNSIFTDPGATAIDNVDGDISGNILVTGTVDTTALGTYVLTYDVTDTAGNAAISVTRTVNVNAVSDTTPPVITLLGANPMDVVKNTTFTDPGATAIDNVDGNITSNIAVTGSVNTAVVGQHILTYDVTDSSGNAATPVIRIVNVVFDTVVPTIALNGITPMDIPYGTVYVEDGATWTDNIDGTGAAQVGGQTVNTNVVGTYIITFNYTDSSGNAATQITRTVNVVDNVSPVITLTGTDPMDVLQNTVFTDPGATAIDNADGDISGNILVTGTVDTTALGTYVLTYDVTDTAGNAAISVTRTVNVNAVPDTTPPVITLIGTDPMNILQNSIFTDPGVTAMDNVDGNITASVTVTGVVDTATVGVYILTYDVTDTAGNAAISVTRTVNVNALPICQTGADTDGDGSINNLEILNYIIAWKSGSVSNLLILKAIQLWKVGIDC